VCSSDLNICSIHRPADEVFKEQLVWLRNYGDLRVDRIGEITIQTDDIMPFFGAAALLNNSRRKNTVDLLRLAQSVAIHLEMQIKHFCWAPRPIDFAIEVQPIIQTPDHSSFPSGHATEAFTIATILNRLENAKSAKHGVNERNMYYRIAHRIAVNRTIAGVHFPVDSAAGAVLGCMIGDAIISLATGEAHSKAEFTDTAFSSELNPDFTQQWLQQASKHFKKAGKWTGDDNQLFAKYWRATETEWR